MCVRECHQWSQFLPFSLVTKQNSRKNNRPVGKILENTDLENADLENIDLANKDLHVGKKTQMCRKYCKIKNNSLCLRAIKYFYFSCYLRAQYIWSQVYDLSFSVFCPCLFLSILQFCYFRAFQIKKPFPLHSQLDFIFVLVFLSIECQFLLPTMYM